MNNFYEAQVGHSSDAPGVVGEVKRICSAEPALNMIVAVDRAYMDVKRRGL